MYSTARRSADTCVYCDTKLTTAQAMLDTGCAALLDDAAGCTTLLEEDKDCTEGDSTECIAAVRLCSTEFAEEVFRVVGSRLFSTTTYQTLL